MASRDVVDAVIDQAPMSPELGQLHAAQVVELIPIAQVYGSPLNPRKHFDERRLQELASSIREKGILQALTVRVHEAKSGDDRYEIVIGERRYRAALLVGLAELPCVVRAYTDVQVLEVMAIENDQREDVHPLERAEGYRALMQADPSYTIETLALKVGKSATTVRDTVKLLECIPGVQDAFLAGGITASHALEIARLSPGDQADALQACFDTVFGHDDMQGLISVKQLRRWIHRNVRLVPDPSNPEVQALPELASALGGPEPLRLLQVAGFAEHAARIAAEAVGVITGGNWVHVGSGKKERCKFAQRAVLVLGDDRGKLVDVCIEKTQCQKHWPWEFSQAQREAAPATKARTSVVSTAATKKAAEAHKQRQVQEQRWLAAKSRALTQLKKVTVKPGPAVLAVLAVAHLKTTSWTELVIQVLEDDLFLRSPADWKRAVAIFKPFGIKLDAIERELFYGVAQKKAAPAASAKKKARR